MAEPGPASPYPGPRPFEANESRIFFGREREKNDLLSLTIAHRALLVYSASGAGKTSLLNAGLIPLLREEGFDVLPAARVRGAIPAGLAPRDIGNVYAFHALMSWNPGAADPRTLAGMALADFLSRPRGAEAGERVPRVAIFDQFEEVFTTGDDRWRDRVPFFTQLRDAMKDDLLRVIFVIREEFLAHIDPYAARLPDQLRTRYRLERLREDAAVAAVQEPARTAGRAITDDTARALVRELMRIRVQTEGGAVEEIAGEFVEPVLLQVLCQDLWTEIGGNGATPATPQTRASSDVNDTLAEFYDRGLRDAVTRTGVLEADLRRWFQHRLITTNGTRGTVYRGLESTDGIPNRVVDALENFHLVRRGPTWYELPHDRFIEPILRSNRRWLRDRLPADKLELRERLEARAEALQREAPGGDRGFHDDELAAAEGLLALPGAIEIGFSDAFIAAVQASQAARQQRQLEQTRQLADEQAQRLAVEEQRAGEQARSARRFRWMTVALAVLLAVAAGAAFYADLQRRHAETARLAADIARQRAEAQRSAAVNYFQALNLELEARRIEPESKAAAEALRVEARQARQKAVDAERQVEGASVQQAVAPPPAPRRRVDGRHLAASALGLVSTDPELAILLALQAVAAVEAHDTIEALATAARASRFRLALRGHTDQLYGVVYSPDGQLIATASADRTARLWSSRTGTQVAELRGHGDAVVGVAFSADGRLLATASADTTARLWEVASARSVRELHHPKRVVDVAFSRDGARLATACEDGAARVWNVASGQLLTTVTGHRPAPVFGVGLNGPPGTLLGTVAADQTARLWDASSGRPVAVLKGHQGWLYAIAFSRAGDRVATTALDKTGRIWRVPSGTPEVTLTGHEGMLGKIAWSPDGTRVATASADRTARVWSSTEDKQLLKLVGHGGLVYGVDFNADGTYLVTGSHDKTARIWEISPQAGLDYTTAEDLKKKARARVARDMTPEECRTYLGDCP